MNAQELKTVQAPLKAAYRAEPEKASVTLRAESHALEGVACRLETAQAMIEAGLHPAAGGDGTQACSGDMLLQSLAACAGVTLSAVATSLGIALRDARVFAEGDLDFRGTLGVTRDVPVGFREIRLRFVIDSDAEDGAIAKLLELTERYCVVLQTIRTSPTISVATTRGGAGPASR
jgi:uncharacterized OsmC-like protein